MKKTLIALAALAAAGATLAQSSVTIYGRMDLGMSQQDITVTDRGVPLGTIDALSLAGAQDERTGSRLGFRGTEDLGGGLRAGFVYEFGINPDRGVGVNANTRLANLSLSGGFGTVVVGTFMNAFDTVRNFSPATAGVAGGDFLVAHGTFDGIPATLRTLGASATAAPDLTMHIAGRSQNAIAYVSPNMSGFTFSVGTLKEDTSWSVNGGAASSSDTTGFLLGLGYAQGPLTAQFAFGDVDVDTSSRTATQVTTRTSHDLRNWAFAVRYDLGFVVPTFQYETSELTGAPGVSDEFSAWEIGARFPMGAFAPYITFGDGEFESRDAGGVYTADSRSWQIGTTYNLSARTWVYAAVGEIRVSDREGFRYTRDGYSIGLVHTF